MHKGTGYVFFIVFWGTSVCAMEPSEHSFKRRCVEGVVAAQAGTEGGDLSARPLPQDQQILLKEAQESFEAKDYLKARQLLKPLVDQRLPKACYLLAQIYLENTDGKQLAISTLERAAHHQDKEVLALLAHLYETNGEYQMAFKQYQKLAAQKDAGALVKVGDMYQAGRGCRAEPFEALSCYERAAEGGSIVALTRLGEIYEKGASPVGKDLEKACAYYRKAALLGIARIETFSAVKHEG